MDGKEFDDRRRIGKVKATTNMYGGRILEGSPSMKKSQLGFSESPSESRELHRARRDMSRFKERRNAAESEKVEAELELSNAKKTVKTLSSLIEETNTSVEARRRGVEMQKKSAEIDQYAGVMRELEFVKQELSKLKLDMAIVLGDKKCAEKEIESSRSKISLVSTSVEALRKEIEEVNEEHVIVELARIEAAKEYGEIDALREKEAREFLFAMEETRKKMYDAIEEIEASKDLENRLAVTMSDIDLLQNELRQIKEMDMKEIRRTVSFRESEGSSLLMSITEELEAAKKELDSIREEGFQFMGSMDIIRNELQHVTEEVALSKKKEEKMESTIQKLNSKLLRMKSKLEAVSAAEGKAKSIVSNLSDTLEQLKTEAAAAKKEKELIAEETAAIKAEILLTESEIELTEARLDGATQELEAVKTSEALALEDLKNLIERTKRVRASATQHSSSITISKFEYKYLIGRAVEAEEIADKKVAAAHAWIEALKASEKEKLMKIEMDQREIKETTVEEQHEVYRTEKSLLAHTIVKGELNNWRKKTEKNVEVENMPFTSPRKSMKGNGNLTPSLRAKFRKSASPAIRMSRSTSFTIRERKRPMPNFGRFFAGKTLKDQ
ncbi:hypothetical protein HS088_TW03G00504 [Tripterygium wilfordii]|uniref:Protein PLASTID MOVEMENT IMPAIRED 2 n=1 Tax=Tripterygium wilfordii TaxID=458696 RepID=A0A7J7DUX6_TRIWF|nr:protein PLASTID MOVEMENT IMPAIRED 2 [Tripterygium wilfordii]XP_038697255.1 protein PLASTID MOVEMENT IMPAIRED 2 [Tripterygium wilfordii]KAF5750172.1 hypothetical protein HS088_TW03G00504 [Tripterygium wilfordii]